MNQSQAEMDLVIATNLIETAFSPWTDREVIVVPLMVVELPSFYRLASVVDRIRERFPFMRQEVGSGKVREQTMTEREFSDRRLLRRGERTSRLPIAEPPSDRD